MRLPSLIDADRELVRRGGLYAFVKLAWAEVCPGEKFVDSWHIEQVCLHLEAVSRGDIHRLVINIPPGCMKSLLVSVFWPAWEWIDRPHTCWIYASYDGGLVARDASKQIKLLRSAWFIARWGERVPPESTKLAASDFENLHSGFRFGTSIRGRLTGRHANIRVVDDPIKPLDAAGGATMSKTVLEGCAEWWTNTWPTRIKNPQQPSEVIIMQRLHEDDLAGLALATGDYVHLCFPMRFDPELACKTLWGGDPRTKAGELLMPGHHTEAAVRNQEKRLGPTGAACQLGQRPSRAGGNIFQLDSWGLRFWGPPYLVGHEVKVGQIRAKVEGLPNLHEAYLCQSWDMTFKDTDGSDFVSGGVWACWTDLFYLLHLINDRLSFVNTKNALRSATALYPKAYDKLIEDKANGPAVENDMKGEIPGITLVPPSGGKIARANASSPVFAARRVIFPHPILCPQIEACIKQLKGFPRVKNDDMVDMITQLMVRMRLHGGGALFRQAMAKLRGER